MKCAMATGILALSLVGGVGCNSYEDERPPVDQLDSRDSGLQSKDIINATDQMAQSILADPEINQLPEQLVMVVGDMEDTGSVAGDRFPTKLFLTRLKTALGRHGKGRIQLVDNKDRFRGMQSKELEGEGGAPAPAPAGLQPDCTLNGTFTEMRNRGTSYYYCEFMITGLKGNFARKLLWTDKYEVKVAN